jgi:hypothetical protein
LPHSIAEVRAVTKAYYEESVIRKNGKQFHYFRRGDQEVYSFGIEVRNGEVSDVMWEIIRTMVALNEQDAGGT